MPVASSCSLLARTGHVASSMWPQEEGSGVLPCAGDGRELEVGMSS